MTILKIKIYNDRPPDTEDHYKFKGSLLPRLSRNEKDKNIVFTCNRCNTDILMGARKAALIQVNDRENTIFCSALCKLQSITEGKDITECWVFPKTSFVFDGRAFAMRVMLYHLHFGEHLQGRNLWSACGDRRCVNPHHAERRRKYPTDHE